MFHQWPKLSEEDSRKSEMLNTKINLKEERRKKFLNDKLRTIGVDKIGLKNQIEEKNELKRQEKNENDKHNLWENSLLKTMNETYQQNLLQKKEIQNNLKSSWDFQRDKSKKQEWEIENPNNLYTFQTGSGILLAENIGTKNEDIKIEEKRKKKIQKEFLNNQIEEKRKILKDEKELEKLEAKRLIEIVNIQNELSNQNNLEKLNRNIETKNFNQKQFETQILKKKEFEREENYLGMKSIEFFNNNVMLNEFRINECGKNNKIIRQEWKGFSPMELSEIRKIQSQQRKEKKEKNEIEKEENNKIDESYLNFGKKMNNIHFEQNENKLQRLYLNREFLNQQKEEFKERKVIERNEYLRPGIEESWWPFGKSDR